MRRLVGDEYSSQPAVKDRRSDAGHRPITQRRSWLALTPLPRAMSATEASSLLQASIKYHAWRLLCGCDRPDDDNECVQ